MGDLHVRVYRDGSLAEEGLPLMEAVAHLQRPGTVVWADLYQPSREQLQALVDSFTLHELAVEDALGHQRPKLARFDTHLFLVCHAGHIDIGTGTLERSEVDVFIGDRWLVTVRKQPGFPVKPAVERLGRPPTSGSDGVGFLLYGLLDAVVDTYVGAAEALNDYFEAVSEQMFTDEQRGSPGQQQWFDVTRAMFRLQRLVAPMRGICDSFVHGEHLSVTEPLRPYFQDVHNRVVDVVEDLQSLRQVATTILETEVSLRDSRQNILMKQVTSWAAILAVPTLVTGYYGMNVPYPGSGDVVGVVTSTAVMVVACIVLYRLFRRNQWL